MKTITYRGKQYEVEYWVNFVAMDSDGNIYAYENKPDHNGVNWLIRGKADFIGLGPIEQP